MQVIAIGGATIDVVVAGASRAGGVGTKQDVQSITMGIGGGAVNASLAMRACGAHVRIVCAVGGDAEAEWLRTVLGREAVDLSLIQSIAGLPTGKAVIHLDAAGEASVFAQRGASTQVSPARARNAIDCAELLYVTAISTETEKELDQSLQRRCNPILKLAVNPSMRQLEAYAPSLESLLARTDLVSVNEAEARAWALHRNLRLPNDPLTDIDAWMHQLRHHARQALLVTLGPRGALFHDGERVHYMESTQTDVRSTLGAGDAFAATLAYCWAAGQPTRSGLEAAQEHCLKVLQVAAANLA